MRLFLREETANSRRKTATDLSHIRYSVFRSTLPSTAALAQAWSDVHRGCHSLARLASQLSVALDPIVYASMMRRFRGAGPTERRETDEEGSIRRREQIGEQTRASTTSPHLGRQEPCPPRLRHLVALPVALKQRVRRAPNPREYFEAPR